MTINRRSFLSASATMAVTSALLPGKVFAKMAHLPNRVRRFADYVSRIDDWFYLYDDDSNHQSNLALIDAVDDGSDAQLEKFSLTLCSDLQDVAMPTGYYNVAGEDFSLYINHSHEREGWQFYRAEFCLLQKRIDGRGNKGSQPR